MARAFMFAVGCIQSQTCHTDRCPTGVATQDQDRQRALVVPDKALRVAQFHEKTLMALAEVVGGRACRLINATRLALGNSQTTVLSSLSNSSRSGISREMTTSMGRMMGIRTIMMELLPRIQRWCTSRSFRTLKWQCPSGYHEFLSNLSNRSI